MKRIYWVFAGLVLGAVASGAAQVSCPNGTVAGLFAMGDDQIDDATVDGVMEEVGAAGATNAVQSEVQDRVAAGELAGGASAVRDYLPTLFASLGLGTSGVEEDGSLLLTVNPNFLRFASLQGSGRIVLREAEPYSPLLELVEETERADLEKKLSDGMDDTSDVEFTLSFNRESRTFGRNPLNYRRDLAALFAPLVRETKSVTFSDALLDALDRLGRSPNDVCVEELEEDGELAAAFAALGEDVRGEIEEAVLSLTELADQRQLSTFSSLVSNQPQFNVSASYRHRDDFAGPSELEGSARFEFGMANLNRLRKHCGTNKDPQATVTPHCYETYLELPRVSAALEHESRFFIEADYKRVGDFALPEGFTFGENALSFSSERSEEWSAELGFGTALRVDDQGAPQNRIDVSVRYELVDDDPMAMVGTAMEAAMAMPLRPENRLVGTVTFSQRVTADTTLALELVYSDDPELLTDIDEKFSTRAGIRYSLDRKSD